MELGTLTDRTIVKDSGIAEGGRTRGITTGLRNAVVVHMAHALMPKEEELIVSQMTDDKIAIRREKLILPNVQWRVLPSVRETLLLGVQGGVLPSVQ
jgi:hypothetical protein